jgi:hypothetical protein
MGTYRTLSSTDKRIKVTKVYYSRLCWRMGWLSTYDRDNWANRALFAYAVQLGKRYIRFIDHCQK